MAFDPINVANTIVGTVLIDFTMTPGQEDRAAFVATIGGATVAKTIARVRL